ncbi:Uncharacterized protein OBRU01_18131, partial [Operophtera brumata]
LRHESGGAHSPLDRRAVQRASEVDELSITRSSGGGHPGPGSSCIPVQSRLPKLPSKPAVFDEFGKEIHGIAGPYNEGGEFKLICSVKG